MKWMAARSSLVLGCLTAILTGVGSASAQGPTTVQLPTFESFSVSTSVLVPDRGALVLGGVNRSAYGSVERGVPGLGNLPYAGRLFQNRAWGRESSSSTAAVSAWIHDLSAMDEELLAEAAERRAGATGAGVSSATVADEIKAARLTRALDGTSRRVSDALRRADSIRVSESPKSGNSERVSSISEIRKQAAAEAERREAESRDLIAQGLEAERQGKPHVARIFYQMATRRSDGESQRIAQRYLARLAGD